MDIDQVIAGDAWLQAMENLYGREYVEQLLRNLEQDKTDIDHQNENSEWSLDYRSRLLAAAFIWYNINTASDDIQWLPGWRPRSLKQMYLSVNHAKIKGISANMHFFELYRLLGEQCYFL